MQDFYWEVGSSSISNIFDHHNRKLVHIFLKFKTYFCNSTLLHICFCSTQKRRTSNILLIFLVYTFLNSYFYCILSAPGRVSNLQSSEVNYTSITVTWLSMACLQQNGEITYYSVRYTESSVTSKSLNTTRLSFTASSLFPGTSYTFEVAAVNSEGTGPYEPHVVTTVIPTGTYLYIV